jgi:hypothetical protein
MFMRIVVPPVEVFVVGLEGVAVTVESGARPEVLQVREVSSWYVSGFEMLPEDLGVHIKGIWDDHRTGIFRWMLLM